MKTRHTSLPRVALLLLLSTVFARGVPWAPTGALLTARAYHTATLLGGGEVLATGGLGITNLFSTVVLASAELYNPVAGTWSATGSMTTNRYFHTATLLPNGKVLVAGGYGTNALAGAEFYDPSTATWTPTGPMLTPRYNHTATLLPSGTVLVTGGENVSGPLSSAELYNPLTGTWAPAHALSNARFYHTATSLSDGTVLVAGGGNGTVALSSVELYHPDSDTWTPEGTLTTPRLQHSATLLPDGTVLVAGGWQSASTTPTAEIYDPGAGAWTNTAPMATDRAAHTATFRSDGQVLVTGGFQLSGFDNIALSSVELYDPTLGSWTTSDAMATTRYSHTATLLTDGDVVVAGGQFNIITFLANAERLSLPPFYDIRAGFPGLYSSSMTWGDYDNDGRLDVLLQLGGNSFSPLWHNTGNGFTNDALLLPAPPYYLSPTFASAWGDFDNDGRLDIASDYSGIWRNTGISFSNLNTSLPLSYYGSVAWGDYDNDGRLDLLLSGYSPFGIRGNNSGIYYVATTNSNVLWRNTSDGFVPIKTGPPGVYYGTVAWGDYDGDGRLDILVTVIDPGGHPITQVWHNTGAGFTNINAGLPGVAYGSVAWGDYDNDGRLDILLTGATVLNHPGQPADRALGPFETDDLSTPVSGNPAGYITQIWRNTGSGFTNINAGLPAVWAGSAVWGDYDNDGRLDVLLTGATGSFLIISRVPGFLQITNYQTFARGFISQIWRNTGTGFTNINAGLPGVGYGSAIWGDYDNDGRLDILLAGATAVDISNGGITGSIAQIWRNHTATPSNTPPTAPTGLRATLSRNSVVLSWNAASDAQTPSAGLSYNLRAGTTPGGSDLIGPMAGSDGQRRVVQPGNSQHNLSRTIVDLPPGRPIYWSVQAIDSAFAGSPFAAEQSLTYNTVLTPPSGIPVPGDLNGDGMVSQSEPDAVLANYWPYSPWLYLTNVAGLGGTNVTFALTNSVAGTFSVEYTTNLMDWDYLGPAIPRYLFIDTNAPALPQRYYRLRWP